MGLNMLSTCLLIGILYYAIVPSRGVVSTGSAKVVQMSERKHSRTLLPWLFDISILPRERRQCLPSENPRFISLQSLADATITCAELEKVNIINVSFVNLKSKGVRWNAFQHFRRLVPMNISDCFDAKTTVEAESTLSYFTKSWHPDTVQYTSLRIIDFSQHDKEPVSVVILRSKHMLSFHVLFYKREHFEANFQHINDHGRVSDWQNDMATIVKDRDKNSNSYQRRLHGKRMLGVLLNQVKKLHGQNGALDHLTNVITTPGTSLDGICYLGSGVNISISYTYGIPYYNLTYKGDEAGGVWFSNNVKQVLSCVCICLIVLLCLYLICKSHSTLQLNGNITVSYMVLSICTSLSSFPSYTFMTISIFIILFLTLFIGVFKRRSILRGRDPIEIHDVTAGEEPTLPPPPPPPPDEFE